jgi:DNA-binding transcriptional LysR family regulator
MTKQSLRAQIFGRLDPIALKAFYFAAQELNFTRAAERAGLTQSGVSQHVRNLEKEFETSLFFRSSRKINLTPAGQELGKFVETYLESVGQLIERMTDQKAGLKGVVRCAMPDSFMHSPHYSFFLDAWAEEFPGIDMRIRFESSDVVGDLITADQVDFGFVVKRLERDGIVLREISREEYVLVGRDRVAPDLSTPEAVTRLGFVNFPGMETLFYQWFESQFPREHAIRFSSLSIKGEVDCHDFAAELAVRGFGVGIFPRNCVQDRLLEKKLFSYAKRKGDTPQSVVYLATPRHQILPKRVCAVIDAFCIGKDKRHPFTTRLK